jgi:hypothetical protein
VPSRARATDGTVRRNARAASISTSVECAVVASLDALNVDDNLTRHESQDRRTRRLVNVVEIAVLLALFCVCDSLISETAVMSSDQQMTSYVAVK